tara:strand:- start:475 stop:1176 length:702 start_codon:yes stop_codon:yes gene_type:complete
MKKFLYYLLDTFVMTDFTNLVAAEINKSNKENDLIIFDVGCYIGNFSKNLKKKIKKNSKFYLFDANPNLEVKDFTYEKLAISDKKGFEDFYINNFLPHSGSSLNNIHVKDKLWNLTRKIISGSLNQSYTTVKVQTQTLDEYCLIQNIKQIDILKIDTEGSEIKVLKGAEKILKNVQILVLEILDKKNKFIDKKKYIFDLLEQKYGFYKVSEKNIWSLGTLSSMRAVDVLFIKK